MYERVAIVTGGSGRIGSSVLTRLAADGYRCVNLDCHEAPPAAGQSQGIAQELVDVRDVAGVAAAVERTHERFGRIDALVHCAGVLGPQEHLEACDWARLHDVLAVNLEAGVVLSRAVLPGMRSRGSGVIVFIASIVAAKGSASSPVYSAAKAGLIGFARGLAKQVGRHQIRVTCVCPGSVANSTFGASTGLPDPRAALALRGRIPMGRQIDAADISYVVSFLCGDEAALVTGTEIVIDAGESLRMD